MSMAQQRYLSVADVQQICDPIFANMLKEYGFTTSEVLEEEDFDGAYIFRVTAHVATQVSANLLIDVNQELHTALRKKGEDRFVILSITSQAYAADDVEEDID